MSPRTIIHIRHGQTDWNAARRLQGSKDIPLNATGREQAARNGRALAEELDARGRTAAEFTFVASPLARARETMEIVRRQLGLDVSGYATTPALSEVSYGDFEGLTYEDIAVSDPASHAAILADKWHFLPPNGESYVMLTERVGGWLAASRGDLVIVSHGGVFRALKGVIETERDPALAELFVPQDRFYVWTGTDGVWR